jgi:hypothetical protein
MRAEQPHTDSKEKTIMQSMTVAQSNDQFIFTVEGQEQQAPLTKEELLNVLVFAEQTDKAITDQLIEYLTKDDGSPLYKSAETQSIVVPHLPFTFNSDDLPMISAVISDVLAPPLDGDESHVEQIVRICAEAEKMFDNLYSE